MLPFGNMSDDAIWKALADESRREILDHLRDEALTTGNLVERFPHLSRCAVMKHLGVLERAGLILVRREGRYRWNRINPAPIRQIYDRWMSPHLRTQQLAAMASGLAQHLKGGKKKGKKR